MDTDHVVQVAAVVSALSAVSEMEWYGCYLAIVVTPCYIPTWIKV